MSHNYLRRHLASEGVVSLGITLSCCVCVCQAAVLVQETVTDVQFSCARFLIVCRSIKLLLVVVVDEVFCLCLGLSHEDNIRKMRVLTFVQIAEGKSELSFETIEKELQLESDEVEPFIIDGELLIVILIVVVVRVPIFAAS